MSETFLDGKVTLYRGDCLEVLRELDENSVDSCVCDPPYHLTSIVKRFGANGAAPAKVGKTGAYARASAGFMGKQWDGGDVAFNPLTWELVFRVLKPGAHLLAFGGTRTYHGMAFAIEAAGFDVRDAIMWHYGQGFPKSHNLGDGWGTALKPATEIICLARKPLSESSIAANVLRHGTGGINIDGCRVKPSSECLGDQCHSPVACEGFGYCRLRNFETPKNHTRSAKAAVSKGIYGDSKGQATHQTEGQKLGRWPANLIHDGSEEVVERFPESDSGEPRPSTGSRQRQSGFHMTDGNGGFGDSGSAARFFYTAKADADDRLGSKHPTVKPLDLMQYLVRLVTPKGGLVLDPFAGTGTSGEAAWREGMRAVLIEREAEYQADIARRMALCLAGPDERVRERIKASGKVEDAGPLFGGAT